MEIKEKKLATIPNKLKSYKFTPYNSEGICSGLQANKGITLIELLIGISLFSIVIVAFLQLFTSAFKEQSKILSKTELLNSGSYASEYVSRALRMARKAEDAICIPVGTNYAATTNGIKFLNHNSECQEFRLTGNILETNKVGLGSAQSLTPSNLTVESLKFNIFGDQAGDTAQPKITFVLKLKINTETLNIQTTVSQRDLDVET
ncbi:prepilin-type N-terminal cleavage/methylation domain-containing protein [Patescibacteria group bacterium]|nr:prepilin-type N-terminal cleavage/methylation domain-containing protein [Patescibacteria group bacterium]